MHYRWDLYDAEEGFYHILTILHSGENCDENTNQ